MRGDIFQATHRDWTPVYIFAKSGCFLGDPGCELLDCESGAGRGPGRPVGSEWEGAALLGAWGLGQGVAPRVVPAWKLPTNMVSCLLCLTWGQHIATLETLAAPG